MAENTIYKTENDKNEELKWDKKQKKETEMQKKTNETKQLLKKCTHDRF